MGKTAKSILDLIGDTPLLEVDRYAREVDLQDIKLYAKLESFNATGSVKDRIALAMIEDAEEKGLLKPGATIIEPTSGNAGIGLAAVAAVKGYKAIFTLPENVSEDRKKILKAYGAKLAFTSVEKGMKGAIEMAEKLHANIEDSIILGEFSNSANPNVHYINTGPEIWEQTDGKVDIFVAGVGTGGTITGVGEYLKVKNPNVQIVAVEPKGSPLLSEGRTGPHRIQGIGAGFIPKVLNTKIFDQIYAIENEAAFEEARRFAICEGALVGISSGAVLKAARILAEQPENQKKTIVVLLPDSGDRYLSTSLFNQETY